MTAAAPPSEPLLGVAGLQAGYGAAAILFGIDLAVARGEVVSLLGRNGMGKTTLVRTLTGQLAASAGTIRFAGRTITAWPSHQRAQAGLGLVPEGRQVFPNLTVRENLVVAAHNGRGDGADWTLDRVLALFPRLAERLDNMGNALSGGEQQMVAIGRALMTNPRLLILDEATEGLAPLVRQDIWACLATLKRQGLAIIVIDKHIQALLPLADRHLILSKGRIVWQGGSAALEAERKTLAPYLSV